MKVSTFLGLVAALCVVYGLAFLLFPLQFLAFYTPGLDPVSHIVPRYFGTALLAFAVLDWLSRNQATRAVLLSNFVISAAGLVVATWGALEPTAKPLYWTTVLIYVVLTLGFGYFTFVRKDEQSRAAVGMNA